MSVVFALVAFVNQVSGTPYITGGDSPAGTDCSGLASWVSNVATGRPAFGDRFHTGNQEAALLARGFKYGTAPGALVIGWNSSHTAVTLPDGTPVSSGEGGGVKIGGGGAYQPQFTKHMHLPLDAGQLGPEQLPPLEPELPVIQLAHEGVPPPPPGAPLPPPPGAPLPHEVPPPPPPEALLPPPPPAPVGI